MDRRALARSRTTVKKCAQCHGKLGLGWYFFPLEAFHREFLLLV